MISNLFSNTIERKERVKKDLDIELNIHCHNDLGLASANSLAAYEAGVTLVDVTVNGLGERVGITPISELCVSLKEIYKTQNNWKLELLSELSKKVSKYSGIKISPNTPIIGENAFLHNAGLHVAAILINPRLYEPFPAELIGGNRDIVLDKMASRQTVKHKLMQLGINTNENQEKILQYAKSKEKGTITNNEMINILNIRSI